MIGVVRVKDGVVFSKIAPSGFRILAAVDQTAKELEIDLTVTSGTDGDHSGPNDPHHRGEAYDIRSQGLTQHFKDLVLRNVMAKLEFERFYGFLEAEGTSNEHFHFQVKKDTEYP